MNLLFIPGGINPRQVRNATIENIKAFELLNDIVLLHPNKTNKSFDNIPLNVNFYSYHNLFYSIMENKTYSDWRQFYENENWFINFKNVDNIILYGGMLSEGSGLKYDKNGLSKIFDIGNRSQLYFRSVSKYLMCYLQLAKFAHKNNINVIEFTYDPGENTLDQSTIELKKYVKLHGYNSDIANFKRFDSLQHYYKNKNTQLFNVEKKYDLTFGYTVITDERKNYAKKLNSFLSINNNLKYNFFVKDKFDDINTTVNRNKYLNYIEQSKYTLIIPAYRDDMFSIYRFIESINYNCIPLIFDDVVINEFVETFDIDSNIINQIVITYDQDISNTIKKIDRNYLLKYFKGKIFNNNYEYSILKYAY